MAKSLYRIRETGEEVKAYDFDDDVEVKAVDDFELEIIGSTSAVDRDGEILDVKGWDLKKYKKNPIILPAHNYSQPAIGKAKSVKIKDGKLMFKIEFPEEGINPVADVYRKLYMGGFMKASSVGFIAKEWEDLDGKNGVWRKYTKQELLELSLVSVPANPEALTPVKTMLKAFDDGVLDEKDLECVGGACLVKEVEKEVIKEKPVLDKDELKAMIKDVLYEIKDEVKYADLLFGGVDKPQATKEKKGAEIKKSEIVDIVKSVIGGLK